MKAEIFDPWINVVPDGFEVGWKETSWGDSHYKTRKTLRSANRLVRRLRRRGERYRANVAALEAQQAAEELARD